MKAKLLFPTSLLSITTLNAQLIEINENFSGFSQQNFPQNGWISNRTYHTRNYVAKRNKKSTV